MTGLKIAELNDSTFGFTIQTARRKTTKHANTDVIRRGDTQQALPACRSRAIEWVELFAVSTKRFFAW